MNEAIQGNNYDASPAIPVKRKRGRPRKDKSLNRVQSVRPRKGQNLHSAENASVPPGFHGVNGNHPYHVDSIEDASDGMVGQAVTGVVEAVFDAGYLLAVKIGNSNTSLRGVVFKPGHYVPVTAENDVAPRVQMIRRNEIHLPTQNQTRVRGSRSRERHEQHVGYVGNGSPSNELHRLAPMTANLVSLKGKCTAIVAAPSVPPVGARGTVVPVVLEPVNIPIGQPPTYQMSSAASQAAHMTALKGKHVQTVTPLAVYDPNGSTPAHQILADTSGLLTSHSQTSSHVAPKGVNNEGGAFDQRSVELRHGDEGKSMNSKDSCLPGEVDEEFQGASQSSETHNGSSIKAASKLPAEDSRAVLEQENSDMNEPLYIEPLRTVRTNLHNQSPYVPKLVGHNSVGRMTELLQAVHENLKDTQLRAEHLAACSKVELHEQRIPETNLGD